MTRSKQDDPFLPLARAFASDPAVTEGRMFGSPGLKISGKVFAMLVKGSLVVKLPAERVAALLASGDAEPFDPGHGRVMKAWVSVLPRESKQWLALARQARRFVGGE